MNYYEDLLVEIKKIPVIDTHEHLPNEKERISGEVDVTTLFSHYCRSDFVSAGLSENEYNEMINTKGNLKERMKVFFRVWEDVKTTAYCRNAVRTLKDIYGFKGVTKKNYREISEIIRKKNKKGLYRFILHEKCNIKTSINHVYHFNIDKEFFLPVIRAEKYSQLSSREKISLIEKENKVTIRTFDRYLELLEKIILDSKRKGSVGIKFGSAYSRNLNFIERNKDTAESIFNKVNNKKGSDSLLSYNEMIILDDFLTHEILKYAEKESLVAIFHTGILAGNKRNLAQTNPMPLISLFKKYQNLKFDIFHAGIPWITEVAILSKHFPNVFIDLCWSHIISPELSVRAIREYVDLVPRNKILGFGGDLRVIEKVYGHLCIAQENFARAFDELINVGRISFDEAVITIRKYLYDNPKKLYGIN